MEKCFYITNGESLDEQTITNNVVHKIKLPKHTQGQKKVVITVIDGTIHISNFGDIQAGAKDKPEYFRFNISEESPLTVTGVGTQTSQYSVSCPTY